MPSRTEALIKELLETIDSKIGAFNGSVPDLQRKIFDKIQTLLKDLRLTGNNVANTVENIRKIGALKKEIESIVLNPAYLKNVVDFAKGFDVVTKLQNQFFNAQVKDFKPRLVLNAIKQESINTTVASLTESGIHVNVTEGIQKILRTNITTGGKYTDLIEQMRTFITTDSKGLGALEKYTRQITTDSLNQYSANYNQVVASNLNLKWRMFTGSNLATTRDWCEAMRDLQYFHVDDIPEILKGHIGAHQVKINPKTKLWYGAIPGTTPENLETNRGGYNCGHQIFAITETMVPKDVLARHKQSPPEAKPQITRKTDSTAHPTAAPIAEAFPKKDASVKSFVNNALKIIDQVHGDGDLSKIPIRELIAESGYGGYFKISEISGLPEQIRVNPKSAHPELSFIHELGHFLDYNVLGGTKKSMASEFRPKEMQPVMSAIYSSKAIGDLEKYRASGIIIFNGRPRKVDFTGYEYLEYLTSDVEVWARAYAQYVATRSADAKLIAQLNITRSLEDPVNSRRQWSDEDFEAIANAIDKMFEDMNWKVKNKPSTR